MRSEQDINLAMEKYADTVRRICFVHLKNYQDSEDVFQEVFLKYVLNEKGFQSDAHEKAWLIRVAINACKDSLKSFFRRKVVSLDELMVEPLFLEDDKREALDAVMRLQPNYKNVIYLFYFEGYSALEIAAILKKKENTVYTWLARARAELKTGLEGEPFEE
jgi:RNA polymerase sigma-70 factor (ECF subfamily)